MFCWGEGEECNAAHLAGRPPEGYVKEKQEPEFLYQLAKGKQQAAQPYQGWDSNPYRLSPTGT